MKTVTVNGKYFTAWSNNDGIQVITRTKTHTDIESIFINRIESADSLRASYKNDTEKVQEYLEQLLDDDETVGNNFDSFIAEFRSFDNCQTIQRLSEVDFEDGVFGMGSLTLLSMTSFSIASTYDAVSQPSTLTVPIGDANRHEISSFDKYIVIASTKKQIATSDAIPESSFIMTFSITEGTESRIKASSLGFVPGYVINQFSVHHTVTDGRNFLYVATTSSVGNSTATTSVYNALSPPEHTHYFDSNSISHTKSFLEMIPYAPVNSNIRTERRSMPVVGHVTDFGEKGGYIRSVKFDQNRAIVATFKSAGIVSNVDLSDPYDPIVVSEFAMDGFVVNYLQPIKISSDTEDFDLFVAHGISVSQNCSNVALMMKLLDVTDALSINLVDSLSDRASIRYDPTVAAIDSRIENIGNCRELIGLNSNIDDGFEVDNRSLRYYESSELLFVSWKDLMPPYHGFSHQAGFRLYQIDLKLGFIPPYLSINQTAGNVCSLRRSTGLRSYVFENEDAITDADASTIFTFGGGYSAQSHFVDNNGTNITERYDPIVVDSHATMCASMLDDAFSL